VVEVGLEAQVELVALLVQVDAMVKVAAAVQAELLARYS
jgi:hypothetical protein